MSIFALVICLCPTFRLLKWLGKSERLETLTINRVKGLKLSDYSDYPGATLFQSLIPCAFLLRFSVSWFFKYC
jgi:hypothetical protein